MKRKKLTIEELIAGVLVGDRLVLSRAITLCESQKAEDIIASEKLLKAILPKTGNSMRIGITGVPGVGKSTFIESFGTLLTTQGKKLAVLTVDPSSQKTKGSILGDKTRMEELARNPMAFIRPSASGSALGGVSSKTREAMLLCEAAGFDIIFIETVGVGQSETLVHGMVDFFLLLMLAGAGDELQGIKKGIMEMADAVVINKADGENQKAANRAKAEYQSALHLFPIDESGWLPQVKTCSALENIGLDEIWEMIVKHQISMQTNGFWTENRKRQQVDWFKESVNEMLGQAFYHDAKIAKVLPTILKQVESGELPAMSAAYNLIQKFLDK
ncbi:methylmalonyl Co-A mutase-associated GTPase MeaB [Roseivirga sp. E12]|uniref:methylmalonyl Co-A mutase-associated GTPase MeaB n=1 Tax=Roseivirga sp. E12 TaxID=2819237 RepID=UPI001ABD20C8|nr:methylmalonyl Co-A mutase-associated GTPase MeaB [Roseivirga sp. E12]MBO3699010.1 methylmalonyl Co-A mutase-associated GTPase MeaB [Roseivirga sp. E12]